jgi:succinoglycan biosynthesis protein ExoA
VIHAKSIDNGFEPGADELAGVPSAFSLSIVIPTRGRLVSLQKCLASIAMSELPEKTELLVVCNGSDPETERFLHERAESDLRLRLLEVNEGSPADARNAALGLAQGDIVYFLDDDVTIAPDLFSRALTTFSNRPEVDVLGGPNLTPLGASDFEQCVGRVLASRLGSGLVCDRYRSRGSLRRTSDRSLILCNLAIRRRAIASRNPVFWGDLVCNEENLLLGLLAGENRGMLHDPSLIVYHSRRSTLVSFAQQIFRYGRGRCQNTLLLPGSLSPIFLIPVFFLLYLVSLTLLRTLGSMLPLVIYALAVTATAVLEAVHNRAISRIPLMMMLYPTCHLAYATGFVYQLGLSVFDAEKRRLLSESTIDPEQT